MDSSTLLSGMLFGAAFSCHWKWKAVIHGGSWMGRGPPIQSFKKFSQVSNFSYSPPSPTPVAAESVGTICLPHSQSGPLSNLKALAISTQVCLFGNGLLISVELRSQEHPMADSPKWPQKCRHLGRKCRRLSPKHLPLCRSVHLLGSSISPGKPPQAPFQTGLPPARPPLSHTGTQGASRVGLWRSQAPKPPGPLSAFQRGAFSPGRCEAAGTRCPPARAPPPTCGRRAEWKAWSGRCCGCRCPR